MTRDFRSWDDYVQPNGTLHNRLGIEDAAVLSRAEQDISALRIAELSVRPIDRGFDYRHLQVLHHYIFGDVYDWAGQTRVGPAHPQLMVKDGYSYAPAHAVESWLSDQFHGLRNRDFLRGLDLDDFADQLADLWAEVNFAHPFREGNTRTQFVFFSQLAAAAGWRLQSELFEPGQPLRDEFIAARYWAHGHDSSKLADVLRRALTPAV